MNAGNVLSECFMPEVARKEGCIMATPIGENTFGCSDPDSREECGRKVNRTDLDGGQLMRMHGFVPVTSPGDAGY